MLAIREKELGAEHPHVATSLNNLVELYRDQGKYAGIEAFFDSPDEGLVRVVNFCCWLIREVPAMSGVRPLTPQDRTFKSHVRFRADCVCFTSRSRPSRWCRRW